MNVYLIQANGHDCSSSVDEFENHSNQLVNSYGTHDQKYGWLKTQSEYIIVVDGALVTERLTQLLQSLTSGFADWLKELALTRFWLS